MRSAIIVDIAIKSRRLVISVPSEARVASHPAYSITRSPCMSLPTAFGSLLAMTLFCPAPSLAQQPLPPPDSVRLHQILAQNWAYTMHEFPEYATAVGYPGQNARWTDYSLEAIARRKRELNDPLTALRAIDRAKLSANDQLSYDLFRHDAIDALDESRFPGELMLVNHLGAVQQDVPSTIAQMPTGSVRDHEDILDRLRAGPLLANQTSVRR